MESYWQYKTLWEMASFLSNIVFEKQVISHSNIRRLQAWSLLFCIWKHTNLCKNVFFFFFHYSLATITKWVKMFTDLLFYVCWDTPSENILVCESCQTCLVPLLTRLIKSLSDLFALLEKNIVLQKAVNNEAWKVYY